MKMPPIKDRIVAAIRSKGGSVGYYDLAHIVFPKAQYPNAFSSPNKGGPPGCYMVLSRAIREHGFHMQFSNDPRSGVVHSTIYMGSATKGGAQ
jgi:hypothetical protein